MSDELPRREIRCPVCLGQVRVKDDGQEHIARCSGCGHIFRVAAALSGPRAGALVPAAAAVAAATPQCAPPSAPRGSERVISISMDVDPAPAPSVASAPPCGAPRVGGAPELTPRSALAHTEPMACLDIAVRPAATAARSPAPVKHHCSRHLRVRAELACEACEVPMCRTCALEFPGDVVLCPTCAVSPGAKPGPPGRIALVVASGLLALLGLAAWIALVAAAAGDSESGPSAFGELAAIAGLASALIALGCALAPFERHHPNPPWLFIGPLLALAASAVWALTLAAGALAEADSALPVPSAATHGASSSTALDGVSGASAPAIGTPGADRAGI